MIQAFRLRTLLAASTAAITLVSAVSTWAFQAAATPELTAAEVLKLCAPFGMTPPPTLAQRLKAPAANANEAALRAYCAQLGFKVSVATVAEVISTGTFIQGVAEEAALAVEAYSREDLLGSPGRAQGPQTRVAPAPPPVVQQREVPPPALAAAPAANGVETINLRGFGAGRTMVLMNGARLADQPMTPGGQINSTGGAVQNVNAIPMEVLSQIQVLKDGGGAAYGSDAVAGAVNFVTSGNAGVYLAQGSSSGQIDAVQMVRSADEPAPAGEIQTAALLRGLSDFAARGRPGVSEPNADLGFGRTAITVNGVRLTQSNIQYMPLEVLHWVAANTERYRPVDRGPIKQVAVEPVSTFSIDVDTASYSNVRRFLQDGQRPPTDAVRIEEMVNYFDYGYAAPTSQSEPFKPFVAVAPSPWSPGKQIIHIGVQGYRPAASERPPLNLVFLVDTSGSMASADRLPLAQRSLNILVDQLRPDDRVALVAYAGSAGVVLAPTAGDNRAAIREAIDRLQSGGSTAGGAGLSLAYNLAQQNFDEDAVNRVILMTDGDFNVGVTDNARLEDFVEAKRETGVYLSVYGFGRGNYQDARMQVLAQNGNGTAAYVDTVDEARKLFRDDFDGSMLPIADDVKIQVEFNPARIAEYRLIGYETRMLRREDFNNDAVDAGEVGAGVSVTAVYEVTPVGGPRSMDPLRYGQPNVAPQAQNAELAFLKIRYKLPGEESSKLIEQPIGRAATYASLAEAPEATRWAAAVAAYGQKLREDPYVGTRFSWDDALNLAQGARGQDEYGLRAEFIRLIRSASELTSANAGL